MTEILNDQNFLGAITAESLAALKQDGTIVRVRKGAFVHRRGDDRPGLSVVLEGRVQIGNLTRDGTQNITLECGPGHTFGEITNFVPAARTHDVVALEDTLVLQVPSSAVHRLLQAHPDLAAALLRVLSARLHLALDMLEDFRANDPAGRLASALLRRARAQPAPTCIHVTQTDLAYEIGVSRVTLGKLLKSFERRGVLRRDYGRLHVLDRGALLDMREPTD